MQLAKIHESYQVVTRESKNNTKQVGSDTSSASEFLVSARCESLAAIVKLANLVSDAACEPPLAILRQLKDARTSNDAHQRNEETTSAIADVPILANLCCAVGDRLTAALGGSNRAFDDIERVMRQEGLDHSLLECATILAAFGREIKSGRGTASPEVSPDYFVLRAIRDLAHHLGGFVREAGERLEHYLCGELALPKGSRDPHGEVEADHQPAAVTYPDQKSLPAAPSLGDLVELRPSKMDHKALTTERAGGRISPAAPLAAFICDDLRIPTRRGFIKVLAIGHPEIAAPNFQAEPEKSAAEGDLSVEYPPLMRRGTLPTTLTAKIVSASVAFARPTEADPLVARVRSQNQTVRYVLSADPDNRGPISAARFEELRPKSDEMAYLRAALPIPKELEVRLERLSARGLHDEIFRQVSTFLTFDSPNQEVMQYVCHDEFGEFIREHCEHLPLIMSVLKRGHCDLLAWYESALLRAWGVPAWVTTDIVATENGKAFNFSCLHARVLRLNDNRQWTLHDPTGDVKVDAAMRPDVLPAKHLSRLATDFGAARDTAARVEALTRFADAVTALRVSAEIQSQDRREVLVEDLAERLTAAISFAANKEIFDGIEGGICVGNLLERLPRNEQGVAVAYQILDRLVNLGISTDLKTTSLTWAWGNAWEPPELVRPGYRRVVEWIHTVEHDGQFGGDPSALCHFDSKHTGAHILEQFRKLQTKRFNFGAMVPVDDGLRRAFRTVPDVALRSREENSFDRWYVKSFPLSAGPKGQEVSVQFSSPSFGESDLAGSILDDISAKPHPVLLKMLKKGVYPFADFNSSDGLIFRGSSQQRKESASTTAISRSLLLLEVQFQRACRDPIDQSLVCKAWEVDSTTFRSILTSYLGFDGRRRHEANIAAITEKPLAKSNVILSALTQEMLADISGRRSIYMKASDLYLSTRDETKLSGAFDRCMRRLDLHPSNALAKELDDLAPYVPGDPLNRVDWSVYARTHTLWVRKAPAPARTETEEIHFVFDISLCPYAALQQEVMLRCVMSRAQSRVCMIGTIGNNSAPVYVRAPAHMGAFESMVKILNPNPRTRDATDAGLTMANGKAPARIVAFSSNLSRLLAMKHLYAGSIFEPFYLGAKEVRIFPFPRPEWVAGKQSPQ